MDPTAPESPAEHAPQELRAGRLLLLHELRDRSLWFVRLRWWVPPLIWAGLLIAEILQIRLEPYTLFLVSLFILAYNLLFHLWHRRFGIQPEQQTEDQLRSFTRWQVIFDFTAIFIFVHFTGGGSSPFVFFFIFHIIFSSILLKHRTAWGFAVIAALGMGLLTAAENLGYLQHHPMTLRGATVIALTGQALPALVTWVFFAVTVVVSSLVTTSIMEMVRRRILRLAELSEAVLLLNNKLRSLHTIVNTMVGSRRTDRILDVVCSELSRVMAVQGMSVKFLSEDGEKLRYAASHGLPSRFAAGRELDVARSPLNKRILEGESFTTGQVTQQELFQLGEEVAAAQVQSVLFVPLRSETGVIGILGAYARAPERFGQDDIDFLRLASELVAIALENARAYRAVEDLGQERERFSFRVAHNLRAPLAAMVSMLDILSEGYTGGMSTAQVQYLQRIKRRATSLSELVNELMVLATSHGGRGGQTRIRVDLSGLVAHVGRTFRDKATERDQRFTVDAPEDLPPVLGDPEMLERMLENLVSNAIKYTPLGGMVRVRLSFAPDGRLLLEVTDSGIGIPKAVQQKLFTEFFRAENAKAMESAGTGLGLVIARDIVEQHGGTIRLESEEGRGTTFFVTLPPAPADRTAGPEPAAGQEPPHRS
jgi:signal transduction histidine kinase